MDEGKSVSVSETGVSQTGVSKTSVSQTKTVVSDGNGGGVGDILDGGGQDLLLMLSLLQFDLDGIGGGGDIHGLKGGSFVLDGGLGNGGDGVNSVAETGVGKNHTGVGR